MRSVLISQSPGFVNLPLNIEDANNSIIIISVLESINLFKSKTSLVKKYIIILSQKCAEENSMYLRGDIFMAKRLVCIDVYTVEAGDTLYSIAGRYDIPVHLLMKVNRIRNPYNLRIGRKLCIPGMPDQGSSPCNPPGNRPASPCPGPVPLPTPDLPGESPVCRGTLHTVTAGDTLYMIAKKYRVNLGAIMDANPDVDPYNLRIGMKICVPR